MLGTGLSSAVQVITRGVSQHLISDDLADTPRDKACLRLFAFRACDGGFQGCPVREATSGYPEAKALPGAVQAMSTGHFMPAERAVSVWHRMLNTIPVSPETRDRDHILPVYRRGSVSLPLMLFGCRFLGWQTLLPFPALRLL